MNRTITDEQIQRMRDICEDATGMVECNCGGPCEGTCTYSMATVMLAELDQLSNSRARQCMACGAIEGQGHHDEQHKLLLTNLEKHGDSLYCQPCLAGTLEMENPAEYLLSKAAKLQTDFWNALGELEAELGCDVDGNSDLEGATVESLKEEENA